MIFASLQDAGPYEGLSRRFRAAFEYLRRTDLASVLDGTHQVEGDDVFAMFQHNAMKPRPACRWEAHRKYADIQLVIAGQEGMGVAPLADFDVEVPYDDAKDVGFHRPKHPLGGPDNNGTVAWVRTGEFALFLPSDVHMPLIAPPGGEGAIVHKVVMKVRV